MDILCHNYLSSFCQQHMQNEAHISFPLGFEGKISFTQFVSTCKIGADVMV